MAVSYAYANRFVGQEVIAHCVGGRTYRGVVQRVSSDTMYLRVIGGGTAPVAGKSKKGNILTANKPSKVEGQEVYWWGPGALALPLFAVLALSLPFLW
ncbi:hypothetical protein [Ammoniphilus sp. CFH 90114]|uniref:hypothetical protein n=1 Tax=Ammoniphilus sp. CFH 90114 TaxID=2493665 RepID=UPI00100F5327|nr:hypothetical protein [Ammoniphilus sp. CFH 90114]RXT06435.1 hypothetical protein EIZ39_15305 [Ammoniphilus sp. CFH 90114]